MIEIKTFVVNPLEVNCYVISDDSNEAVIIDCASLGESEWNEIYTYINNKGLKVKHLINTHMHFDHVMGNNFAIRDFDLKLEAHPDDKEVYANCKNMIRQLIGIDLNIEEQPKIAVELMDGSKITFGNHTLEVIHTPGHTPGGICLYCKEENVCFTGDTLFRCSIGRTDLGYGSSYDTLINSLSKLCHLPDDTAIYPGHGESTTIGFEKLHNPFF